MKALVLLTTGKLRERPDLTRALDILDEAGIATDLRASKDFADVLAQAESWARDCDLIIAAGGDGTVRGVADLAAKVGLPLGLLPLGTANDFARTLGVPNDLAAAARIIAEGRSARIDMGVVNGESFLNVASIGLSEEVTLHLTTERKRRWGALSYAIALSDVIKARRRFAVEITCDGVSKSLRAIQVGVANGRFHGGGFEVSPTARIDDGMLCAYAIAPQPLGKLLLMAASTKIGAHNLWDGVQWFQGKRIEVRTKRPRRVNVDGELLTRTPAVVELRRGAIEVFVPQSFRQSISGANAA